MVFNTLKALADKAYDMLGKLRVNKVNTLIKDGKNNNTYARQLTNGVETWEEVTSSSWAWRDFPNTSGYQQVFSKGDVNVIVTKLGTASGTFASIQFQFASSRPWFYLEEDVYGTGAVRADGNYGSSTGTTIRTNYGYGRGSYTKVALADLNAKKVYSFEVLIGNYRRDTNSNPQYCAIRW